MGRVWLVVALGLMSAACLVPEGGRWRKPERLAAGDAKTGQPDPASRRPGGSPAGVVPEAGPMVRVDGGPFLRGTPEGEGDEGEQPRRRLNLDTFWMDTYEVTARQYRRCVEAGACTIPSVDGLACAGDGFNWGRDDRLDHPVNCVSILQARDYCRWVGKRLPTEAEWEKAARGDKDAREYPWGDAPATCQHGCMNGHEMGCAQPSTCEVGQFPRGRSPYGLYDMAGNVWEWVEDWYAGDYYAGAPERNPTGPTRATGERVVRGGSYDDIPLYQRLAYRFNFVEPDTFSYVYIGFRCVR